MSIAYERGQAHIGEGHIVVMSEICVTSQSDHPTAIFVEFSLTHSLLRGCRRKVHFVICNGLER